MSQQLSKAKRIIRKGLLEAEVNELFSDLLSSAGYAGMECRHYSRGINFIIRSKNPTAVLGPDSRHRREILGCLQQRFNLKKDRVDIFVEKVTDKALCAMVQAERIKFKLAQGLTTRRAAHSTVRACMEAGAIGVEIVISGKQRSQRAKYTKIKDGYMVTTGESKNRAISSAVRCVKMRQGVLGIKVSIHLPAGATLNGKVVPAPPDDIQLKFGKLKSTVEVTD